MILMACLHHGSKLLHIAAVATFLSLVVCGCATRAPRADGDAMLRAAAPSCRERPPAAYTPDATREERDRIFSLLAFAIVAKSWQPWDAEKRRGYNIGAVLVDEDGQIVCWAVNSIGATDNGTQHAETRLMVNYLDVTKGTNLGKHVVYTTLEPCAMCGGMMTLQSVERAVYGQSDPGYGKAIERLTFDSAAHDGYCPYPRGVQSVPSTLAARERLEKAYAAAGEGGIVKWLGGTDAQRIYEDARREFLAFQPEHAANETVLKAARAYYDKVPGKYVKMPYTLQCPS
jgi:tRNA(Arg) A34 adenosine deaminase TadA